MKEKEKFFQVFTYFCLALSLVSTVTYMIYAILNSSNLVNQIISIIGVIILAIFSVLYMIVGMFAENKKVKIFIIIGSLLLSFYSFSQMIIGITNSKDFVLDFTGKDIKEVVAWANERDILVEQEFQTSDTVLQYKIISQSIKAGTSTKNLKKITVIVSDGIDTSVHAEVTNMVGWKLDDVIHFIDDNHLTNVTIHFEFSDSVPKDIIISQDIIREIKRNDPLTLVSSLGKESELKSVTIDNLVGLDTFHAIVYCGRNYLNCSIEYVYNEEKEEGTVLKQSIKKWSVIQPKDRKELVLTVAKRNEITIPDLTKMSVAELTTWTTNNRLKVEISYEYDDSIKKDHMISSNYKKGDVVQVGDTIQVIVSNGPLRMIAFTDLEEFIKWADENEIAYTVDYQYSDTVGKGKIISSTHKEGQIIKNNDTIKLVISQGGNTIVPNLIGMTKEEVNSSCKKANIICKFIYEDDDKENNIAIKQSMRSGSNVPTDTTVTVTLGK